MSSRATRRHHRDRLNTRTRKILLNHRWLWSPFNPIKLDINQMINRRRDNMQMCSCHSCGNPRHSYGRNTLTVQEWRQEERFKCDLLEVDTIR